MRAKFIYESLNDFGFDENQIVKFIITKFGKVITLELEVEKNHVNQSTEYIFSDLDKNIEWNANSNDIEQFDLGGSRWLTFTIKGRTKDIIEALIKWWYVEKENVYDFIKNHIIYEY